MVKGVHGIYVSAVCHTNRGFLAAADYTGAFSICEIGHTT